MLYIRGCMGFFAQTQNHVYAYTLSPCDVFGFVWVSLSNYFYKPSIQNSSRISLICVNIKLHQVSKIYFAKCLYFIVNLSQEIRPVMFLSSSTCKAFKQVRVKFQALRKDIFQSCNSYK